MPTKCLSLVKGRRIRLTRLDGCGRPVYGDCSQVVSSGFVSVAFTANTTDSDEINVTNAAGEVCVFEPSVTSLTGYGVQIDFCNVDPDLFALVTGQETVEDAQGNVVGFKVNTGVSQEDSGFALEIWAGSASGDACSADGAQGSYGYILLPFIRGGIIGDFTVENGSITFSISGGNTRDGNGWGTGPYPVQLTAAGEAGPLLQPLDSKDHLLMILTDVAPPEAACGCRPVLDPTATPITEIVEDTTGSPTIDFDFTGATATTSVWVDFGDGTWDYVTGSSATHTYTENGTYTVRASSNGEWVEETITVTDA